MADRNRSDLEREQRGSSNPNQTERTEDRSTSSQETGIGGSTRKPNEGRDQGIGSETENRDSVGSSPDSASNRPSGNSIEGDENLDRR